MDVVIFDIEHVKVIWGLFRALFSRLDTNFKMGHCRVNQI